MNEESAYMKLGEVILCNWTLYVKYYVSKIYIYKTKLNFTESWGKTEVLFYIYVSVYHKSIIYRVSQEECARLRESVPYVKLYRYNPKHLYPKLNGYGDNGHRKVWASGVSTYCTPSVTPYSSTAHTRQRNTAS